MSQITWADKVTLDAQPDIARINKVIDEDMNEIKSAHNDADSKLTNLITYSTTEQRIGTWIDNKPIYRIVLNEINITSTSHSFDVSNLDIDEVIKIMPKYKEISSGNDYNEDFDNYYASSTDYRRTFYRTLNDGVNKTLEYRGKATGSVIYTIEYTKTTD